MLVSRTGFLETCSETFVSSQLHHQDPTANLTCLTLQRQCEPTVQTRPWQEKSRQRCIILQQ